MGAGNPAGSVLTRVDRASTPPADAPMTTSCAWASVTWVSIPSLGEGEQGSVDDVGGVYAGVVIEVGSRAGLAESVHPEGHRALAED
jgi:hypothetical protein